MTSWLDSVAEEWSPLHTENTGMAFPLHGSSHECSTLFSSKEYVHGDLCECRETLPTYSALVGLFSCLYLSPVCIFSWDEMLDCTLRTLGYILFFLLCWNWLHEKTDFQAADACKPHLIPVIGCSQPVKSVFAWAVKTVGNKSAVGRGGVGG